MRESLIGHISNRIEMLQSKIASGNGRIMEMENNLVEWQDELDDMIYLLKEIQGQLTQTQKR